MSAGNRMITLEEKRQRIMREQGVDWHTATRILAQRSALVRRQRKLARLAKAGHPRPVVPYDGPRVVIEVMRENMTPQDESNIARQADYLNRGRALRSPE